MAMLFRADDLLVTDEWVRAASGSFAVADVRRVWVTRRRAGRRSRILTAVLGAGLMLLVIAAVGATGWLARNLAWLFLAPVIFLVVGWLGLLDPVAIYLEKRHHELWIATESTVALVYKANAVEANKARRAIERACERYQDSR